MFSKGRVILTLMAALGVCQFAAGAPSVGKPNVEARRTATEALVKSVAGGATSPDVRVFKGPGEYVRSISAPPSSHFPTVVRQGAAPADKAQTFLKQYKPVFMDDSAAVDFRTVRTKALATRSYVRLQQVYSGIPVFGADVIVQADEAGQVSAAFLDIKRNTEDLDSGRVVLTPTLSAAAGESRVLELARRHPNPSGKTDVETEVNGWLAHLDPALQLETSPATLMIFDPEVVGTGGPTRLVWQTILRAVDDPAIAELVLLDAHSGEIALHYSLVHSVLNRVIYDANNTSSDPGTLVRSEGQGAVALADANNAYDYFGDTYDFYNTEHGRNSVDNAGMTLSATVRYCDPSETCPYANAFWSDSAQRMYFGETYASADDVVGHELTHGVTSYESGLIYFNQAGAINESLSDMWGEWVDQANGAGTDTPAVRWLMGEDLPIGAIRDMSNPPAYGDPDRMGSPLFNANIADEGGVHYNSGVGNKLCYLLTDGGTFNGHTVTAMGTSRTADLLYECATNLLTSSADYLDLYILLLQAADNLGYSQADKNNLVKACLAVELGVEPNKLAVGSYTATWALPMRTNYQDSRNQSIYLANEIGRSGRITALSLYVTTVPGQTLNNWTIRMKTTALSAFATASMDATGWTTCYQSNVTVSSTGQATFTFTTPFQYDGTSNLIVDYSFNNASVSAYGVCLAFVPGGNRTVYAASNSTNGDPLTWSGATLPTKYLTTAVPSIALTFSPASATVTNVTSAHANGTFTTGEVIDTDVTFSTAVSVTGSPRLELETGATNRMATYLNGGGTTALRFRYTVVAGDMSADLDYTNGGALQFNGGTIKDTTTQTSATLALPAAGATGSLGANKAIVIDTAPPTVTSISAPSATLTRVGPVTYTVNFSESVSGFDSASDILLNTTGTATATVAVSGSGSGPYTVTLSAISGDGTLGITVKASVCTDTAGNGNTVSSASATFTVDNTAPTVSIGAPSGTLTRSGPITYTVTYGGANAVSLADGNVTLNKSGTANGTAVVSGTGTTTRTVTVSGITGNGTLGISIAAGTASDTAGNAAAAAGPSATFAVDNTAPTVTAVAVQTGLTVDVTFSEAMGTGVTTAANYAISASGRGTLLANPTSVAIVSGNKYRLTWATGEMKNGGDITITASNAQDLAGNAVASSGTHTGGGFGVAPTVTAVAVQTGLTVDVTFSEAMGTGVTTAANYAVSGSGRGTLLANPTSVALVSGNTYRLTWAAGEMKNGGDITITASNAQDLAGNAVASSGTHTGGGIGVAPTVTAVAVQTGLTVDVTFSEAMGTGVTTAANYAVSGSGRGTVLANPTSVALVSGNTYRLTWAAGEMKNGGDITITASNAQDLAGNVVASSSTDTGGGIGVAPTVSTVAVQTGLTVDVTFSEAMGTGVTTAANYAISGSGRGTLAANPTSVALVSGNTYRLTWTTGEMKNSGDITITASNALDLAGNVVASSGTDTGGGIGVAPTVTAVAVQTGLTVDVTFSEAMGTGVTTAGNYAISGSGRGTLLANPTSVALVSGNTYRLTWAAGEMKNGGDITITASNALDLAGNAVASSGTDTGGGIGVAPTVTAVAVQTGLTVDVTFSEAMGTGVTTAANYAVSGSGRGTLLANPTSVALVSGNTYRLTWAAGEMKNGGDITITASNALDLAGNAVASSGTHTGGGIGVAPTVTAVAVQTGLTVDVTFSEAMGTGVTTAGNYAISGSGQGTLLANPTSVALVSGNKYRLTWATGEMKNGGDITITASNALDLAGNAVASSGTDTGGGIGVAPTVTAVAVQTGLTVDVTFSEAMGTGVTTAGNYAISGSGRGTLLANPTSVALVSGNTYRLTWATGEMKNGGDITITASNAQDLAGNAVASSGTHTGGGIGVAPTIGIGAPSATLTTGGPVTYTAIYTGADSVTLANGHVTLNKTGTADGIVAVSGTGTATRTITITGITGDGTLGVSVDAGTASDAAGNTADAAGPSAVFTADNLAPTVTSVTVQTGLSINITLSESMGAGVATPGNYVVSGTGKGTLADSPDTVTQVGGTDTYTLAWTTGEMCNGGDVIVAVSNVQDVAGNPIGSPNSGTHAGGGMGIAPTVTTVAVQTGSTVDVTFSEAMGASAATADYVVSGAGKGTLADNPDSVAQAGATNTYTLTWTAGEMHDGGDLAITVSGAQDLAGNPIGSPNSAFHTGGAIGVAPTVTRIDRNTPAEEVTNASTLIWRVVFSEDVTGSVEPADFTLAKPTAGDPIDGFSVTAVTPVDGTDGTTYEVTCNAGTGDGTLRLDVLTPAAVIADLASNDLVSGFADGPVYVLDKTPPLSPNVTGATPAKTATPTWQWTPSGGGNGTYRFQLDGTTGTWTESTETHYTPSADLLEGTHTLHVQERDETGNWSPDSYFDIFIDVTPPTGSLSINGYAPYTTSREVALNIWGDDGTGSGLARMRFSEDASSWTEWETASGNRTFSLTGAEGTCTVYLEVDDGAGNISTPPSSASIILDTVKPTATIGLVTATPSGADAVQFSVAFSEAVGTTFDAGHVAVTGTLAGTTAVIDGTDPNYTVTITLTDPDADGTVGISVGAGVADRAGNAFEGGASPMCTITNWPIPYFTTQPVGGRKYAGTDHTFTVVPNCSASTMTYQWRWDDGTDHLPVDGPVTPSWSLSNLTTANGGQYWCEVRYDGAMHETEHVALDIANHLTIVESPGSTTKMLDEACSFTVVTDGGFLPLHYLWKQNGTPIPGASSMPSYAIAHVGESDAGRYTVYVTDSNSDAIESDEAALTIASSAPVTGIAGLSVFGVSVILAGAAALRKRRH